MLYDETLEHSTAAAGLILDKAIKLAGGWPKEGGIYPTFASRVLANVSDIAPDLWLDERAGIILAQRIQASGQEFN